MKKLLEQHSFLILVLFLLIFFSLALGFAWYARINIERTLSSLIRANSTGSEIESRLSPSEEAISLLFVGDIMLSRSVGEKIEEIGDYRYPFLESAEFLRQADLTFANLESPISARGRNQGSQYSFRADPRTVEGLTFAGFDVVSLANNHIWDWGSEALTDTVSILETNGIETVGAGRNYEEANQPVVKEVSGNKIAFLAYTNLYPEGLEAGESRPGISDFDSAQKKIVEAKEVADIVVVSLHWGDEYGSRSNQVQQTIGRSLVDAGADLVIGHHPHVIEEIEPYGDGWIIYSLGNFVFDQNFSKATREGLAVFAKVQQKKVVSLETIKVEISPAFQPSFSPL